MLIGDMAIKNLAPKDANSSGRIIKNFRICGSGLYEYHVSEAPLMGLTIPGDYKEEFFKIFRSPEVLEKNKELYARIPIITGHHVRVNTANAKQLAVGMVGDTVKSEVGDDGETYLYTTGTIITGDGIDAYEKLGELSVGYDPIVEWNPGTYKGQEYQAVLTGFNEINHLLICQTARGGHQCMIMDSLDDVKPFNKILNGGKSMGIFNKIFGSKKSMNGDSSVVSVLLQSIAVGADAATQVAKVREIVGDSIDATFDEYLTEIAGDASKAAKEDLAKAINTVDTYYKEHLSGDACMDGDEDKEVIVKKDGDKKNVEVKKGGEETKDVEVKKDGDKKEVKVEEKSNGDEIDYEKLSTMVAEKLKLSMPGDAAPQSPVISGDSAPDAKSSDDVLKEIF